MIQTSIKGIIVAKEVDGLEMGVLSDGTPFLTSKRHAPRSCSVCPARVLVADPFT